MGKALNLRSLLRAGQNINIADLDSAATPGYPGHGKPDSEELTAALGETISDWQERFYAESRLDSTPTRSILVVLQGLDTAGKGGTIRHVFGLIDPQGLKIYAFKVPTEEELSHDFLWRIRRQLPGRGMIGIFDRSHYEDVLVVRVNSLVEEEVWQARYEIINQFEAELAEAGVTIIKCFLHISPETQKDRLLQRLIDPRKHWKYSPGDVKVRRRWPDYMTAYEAVLNRCSTEVAPWYVIPSDNKWYRNWAVARLLEEHLEELAPDWPKADFNVEDEIAAVEQSLA
ncbi:MAG: polyphosphate kinase 2 family protein [Propionibacteriaceae bacterium]|jgi:PPK2 family polyphosphate:nucleotide phosphotransferase|nr:polyphosphate kinase 2 family protein [Propionibacteriaceae bacterium]